MNLPEESPHPDQQWDADGDETPLFRPPFIEEDDEINPLMHMPLIEVQGQAEQDGFVEDELIPVDEPVDEPRAETVATAPIVVAEVSPLESWIPPQSPEPAISFWTLILRPKQAAALRIDGLGSAIERHPNVPSNYVLRGEMYLRLKRYAEAEMDFRRALDLAAAQVESQDWGVVAQVMQDRALAGLRQARSHR